MPIVSLAGGEGPFPTNANCVVAEMDAGLSAHVPVTMFGVEAQRCGVPLGNTDDDF